MILNLKQALTNRSLLVRQAAKKLSMLCPEKPIAFYIHYPSLEIALKEDKHRFFCIKKMDSSFYDVMEVRMIIYWGYGAAGLPEQGKFFSRGCKDLTELLSLLEKWYYKEGNFA